MNNCLQKELSVDLILGHELSDLKNHMLIAVTEQRTKEEIDAFVQEMGDIHA